MSDDIQKRLYEISEVSLEMKFLYGGLRLSGPHNLRPSEVAERFSDFQADLRAQIVAARPAVVALLLCPKAEAEKYRPGALAFIDHVFFEEEIDECVACLKRLASTE